MKKVFKLLIGFLTILPLLYLVFFMVHFMKFASSPEDIIDFDTMFKLHIGTMILIVGLLVFYITHIFKTDKLVGDKKTLWAVVIFMGGIIGMPIYWYQYVWKSHHKNENPNEMDKTILK